MELSEEGGMLTEGTTLWGMNMLNGVGSHPGMAGSEATRQTFTDSTNSMLLRAAVVEGIGQPLLGNPGDSYDPNRRQSVERRSHESGLFRKANLGRGKNHPNEGRVEVLESQCTSLRNSNFLLRKQVERLKVENHAKDEQVAGFRRKVIELDAMLTELRTSKVPPGELPAAPMANPSASVELLVSDHGGGVPTAYPALSGARTKGAQHTTSPTQRLGVAPFAGEDSNNSTRRDVRGEPVLTALSRSRGQVTAPCQVSARSDRYPGPFTADEGLSPANATVARGDTPPVVEASSGRAKLAKEDGGHAIDSSPFQMPPKSELTPAVAKAIRTRLLTGRGKPVDASLNHVFDRASAVGNAEFTVEADSGCVEEPLGAFAVADDAPASGRGVEVVALDQLSRPDPLKDFWADSAGDFVIAQGPGEDFVERASAVGTLSRRLQQAAISAPPAPSEQPVEVPGQSSPPPEPRDVAPTAQEDIVTECIEVALRSWPTAEGTIGAMLPSRNELLPSLSSMDAMADEGSSDCDMSSCINATSRHGEEVQRKDGGSAGGENAISWQRQCSRAAAVARVENRPRLGTPRQARVLSNDTQAVTATINSEPTLPVDAASAAPAVNVENKGKTESVHATRSLRLAGVKGVDAEGRYTHITVCAYCCNPTVDDTPIGLCEGCPRIFCISCLREDMQRGDPAALDVHMLDENAGDVCVKQCAWCVRCSDIEFPPPPADTTPMKHLLEQLLGHDLSRLFRAPVDIDEHPDYVEAVGRESMMDLGTMLRKLQGRKYPRRRGPGQFLEDLARVWRNCRKFAGCDELGQPYYGTAVPGIVQCALILEAMATKHYTTHMSEHAGTDWPETAWGFYRQKTQRANEEVRLRRLDRWGNVEEKEAPPAGGTIEMSGNTISATEEPPTTHVERSVGGVCETSPSLRNMDASRERLPNKRSRTAMQGVVEETGEEGPGYGENEYQPRREWVPSRSGVLVGNLSRAGARQRPTRLPRSKGNTSTEEPVSAATAVASNKARDKESSLLAPQPDCSVLEQLCDVAAVFAKSRMPQVL